jgi:hypothetical protein
VVVKPIADDKYDSLDKNNTLFSHRSGGNWSRSLEHSTLPSSTKHSIREWDGERPWTMNILRRRMENNCTLFSYRSGGNWSRALEHSTLPSSTKHNIREWDEERPWSMNILRRRMATRLEEKPTKHNFVLMSGLPLFCWCQCTGRFWEVTKLSSVALFEYTSQRLC